MIMRLFLLYHVMVAFGLMILSFYMNIGVGCKNKNLTEYWSTCLKMLPSRTPSTACNISYDDEDDHHYRMLLPPPNIAYACCAYYSQYKHIVEIILAIKVNQTTMPIHKEYQCMFLYNSKKENKLGSINSTLVTDYGVAIITCLLPDAEIPCQVRLINFKDYYSPTLKVLAHLRHREKKNKIGACIAPLYGFSTSDSVVRLLEFIEFHKILGIAHFIVYIREVPQWVLYVLRQYEKEGTVTIIPVDLPLDLLHQLPYLYLGYADCVRKTRPFYEYVAFMDTDEFFIPRNGTLISLLHKYLYKPKIIGISFSSLYFITSLPSDENYTQPSLSLKTDTTVTLYTQVKVRRAERILRSGLNKIIIRPEFVTSLHPHSVRNFSNPDLHLKYVAYEDGFVHHYRRVKLDAMRAENWDWIIPGNYTKVIDKTTRKYEKALVKNIKEIIEKFRL